MDNIIDVGCDCHNHGEQNGCFNVASKEFARARVAELEVKLLRDRIADREYTEKKIDLELIKFHRCRK